MLADQALAAGAATFGASGALAVWALGAVLALVLTLLALALTRSEWHAAARVAGRSATQGHRLAGLLTRGGRLAGRAALLTLHRVNGTKLAEREFSPRPASPDSRTPDTRAPEAGGQVETSRPIKPTPAAAKIAAVPPRKPIAPQQETLPLDGPWRFPPISLLGRAPDRAVSGAPSPEALQANARLLETVLADYGVQGSIVEIRPGPVVTLYELEPAPGIRSARVIGLADDIARSLSVAAVRIATVSGRNVIGIELPNAKRETVFLSELLAAEEWTKQQGRLALALGKDISGAPVIADLARMPHLLVAGTTGSGKSVGINAMIVSLLYRLSPDQCRMILIDPKMLELS
ncbi:MAG: cell division protein FtsK, partial [Acidisphaera sp.]|nr:cell division protein FtsK [Acidisphaera sp.]